MLSPILLALVPRQEEARTLRLSSSTLDLYKSVFLPLLEDGPKRCDQLGYEPRVAQRALRMLRDAGLVRSKSVMLEGRAWQFWLVPEAPDPIFAPSPSPPRLLTLEEAFDTCCQAVDSLVGT